ncbi:hypothetical protein Tco_1039017, partial [Tanacetum coccineum]
MLVIKRFRERKKIFKERKLSENFMQRGLIFCKEWSSIYRQENPTVTGGGSELGSELTFLAGSELRTSELDTSELKTSEYSELSTLFQRVTTSELQGRQNRDQGNNARGGGAAGYGGAQNRVGNANPGQARQIKCYNCNAQENGVPLDEEQLLFIACGQDNVIDEDVDEQHVQDLALNVDNVFQADDCDAFDFDLDEPPTAQTMFMANLLSADLVYDEADPSYDSDILSEVHDHDH